jgi:CRP/FNR family transcriptional regulator
MATGNLVPLRSRCPHCPARHSGVCAPLGPDHVRLFEESAAGLELHLRGTDLFCQGERSPSFYVVTHGWAFTYMLLEDGQRQILDFALPGAFLGFQPEPLAPMTYSAGCLTDVRVCAAPRRRLCEMLASDARFAMQMCMVETCQEARVNDHLANVAQRDAEARLAHLVVELFYRMRDRMPGPAPETFDTPLSHSDLGDALGLTREHVSRTLKKLRETGICELRDGVLHITHPAALVTLSGCEHDPRFAHVAVSHRIG